MNQLGADAAVTWSAIAEPGDEFAGMLRAAFGEIESLDLIRKNESAIVVSAIKSCELGDEAEYRFGDLEKTTADALQRWQPRLNSTVTTSAILASRKTCVVTRHSEFWPAQLNDLGWAAPAALWIDGDLELMSRSERSVALVGARSSTKYGEWVTAELVTQVATRKFAVVSGGAYGIDGAAHRTALEVGADTIAVLAGGVDRLYPAGHQSLLLEISNRGLLISELPPGGSPTKWRFLQRNRLIAALTRATLVVEAGWRSGSINTANHASNLGRPVGAVPGSITSPSSAGCHRLIRDSVATLVSSAQDLFELLGESSVEQVELDSLGQLETRALDALSQRPSLLMEVATKAGLTIGEAGSALASLEISGLAENSYGKWTRVGSNL